MAYDKRYEKLSRGSLEETKIMAGGNVFSIQQLQEEIDMNTEIGKKLKTIEKELDKY